MHIFDDDPSSLYFIQSPKWRIELNRIINDPCPTDKERLFLVCFLFEKLKWDEYRIQHFIEHYNKWNTNNIHGRGKYDSHITNRQVNIICEKIRTGQLGSGSQASYNSWSCSETHEKRNSDKGNFNKVETSPSVTMQNANMKNCPCSEFHVSTKDERTRLLESETEVVLIEEVKTYAKINNGNRWYKVSQKKGQFGDFYSIDSGQLLEVTTDDGSTQLGYGKPDRFFSLPKEPEVLSQLIDGLNQLLPEKTPLEKAASNKKK